MLPRISTIGAGTNAEVFGTVSFDLLESLAFEISFVPSPDLTGFLADEPEALGAFLLTTGGRTTVRPLSPVAEDRIALRALSLIKGSLLEPPATNYRPSKMVRRVLVRRVRVGLEILFLFIFLAIKIFMSACGIFCFKGKYDIF